MPLKNKVIWKIPELVAVIRARQKNEFDANIGVTGKRGDGKSTLINKIFLKMKGFRQRKHQVYDRNDVIHLLKDQTFSFCWDDEGINTGYKRDFANKGQQELIKIITAYRDNFNIYATAIPFFYSLDKDLRELIFLHLHIVERGFAVILMPLSDSIHASDPWDTKNNAKLEEKWNAKKQENPEFKIPYHRLSTFAGYLYFDDLTEKQKAFYKSLKKAKRKNAFQTDEEKRQEKEKTFKDRIYDLLLEGKLTKEGIIQSCLAGGLKYSLVRTYLNTRLKNEGRPTLTKVLNPKTQEDLKAQEVKEQLAGIVPNFG